MKFSLGSGYTFAIHHEGNIFCAVLGLISVVSILLGGLNVWSIVFLCVTVTCASFFRDPERVPPKDNNVVVGPADGKIVGIENVLVPLEAGLGAIEMTRISIFLSVFDVHVNRMPVSGKVVHVSYMPGKFFNASLDKASKDNERNTIVIETHHRHKIVCTQIAGLIARRIISDADVGDFFAMGERYGIIKFGSRVDLYIPDSYVLRVSVGQTVVGGETVMALPNNI